MKQKTRKIVNDEFFNRSALKVAPDLLGKYLMRKVDGEIISSKIIEVEAYEGPHDKASHASRGKTPRTAPMFEEAGTIFVYFTYGMHWMLNIVCGPALHPSAVLIRGVEDCVGPGRLTKKLSIDKNLNNKKLGMKTGLWIEEDVVSNNERKIIRSARIGVAYAGPIWSKKLHRFLLA